MSLKKIIVAFFVLTASYSSAQKIIFSSNFENKKMDSAWQIVMGNWRIGDVEQMRIAPAEGGYQYVLCSDSNGNSSENIIRLMINLPDSLQLKKIKISFYYYILSNTQGAKIEGEFYQNEIKDGLRGKPWTTNLVLKKGRWNVFQKIMTVPARANSFRLVFYGLHPVVKKVAIACFDNIIISSL